MPPVAAATAADGSSRPEGHEFDEGLPRPGDLDEEELAEEAFDSDEFRAFLRARYPHRQHRRRHGSSTRSADSDLGDGGSSFGSNGPPPEWDGESLAFQDYAIKARLWLATTKARPRARGPLLLQKLTKTPFETMKYLARDRAWMTSDGNGDELIALMELPENFGEDREEDLLAALAKITFHLRRGKDEHFRAFFSRWDVAMRKVTEHSVVLPERYVGFLLINALVLSDADIKSLLNYSRGSIKPGDIREWIRKHETKLQASQVGIEKEKKGTMTTSSRMTSSAAAHYINAEPNDLEDDEIYAVEEALQDLQGEDEEGHDGEDGDGSVLEEHEAAEVLSTILQQKKKTYMQTLKAKKAKELSRGYSNTFKGKTKSFTMVGHNAPFKEGNYRMTVEELKKVTKCAICRKPGHWHKECPDKDRDRGAPKEAHVLEEAIFCGHLEEHPGEGAFLPGGERLSDEISADVPGHGGPGSSDRRLMAPHVESAYMAELQGDPWEGGSSSDHDIFGVMYGESPKLVSEPVRSNPYPDECCATIDTGCQRMVVGRQTLERLAQRLPPGLPVRTKDQTHRFKSVHGISSTQVVAAVPTSIGQKGSYFMPAVFDNPESVAAPFLISLPFLISCRAVIYLDNETGLRVRFRKQGFTVKCHLGPTGALRIPLCEFTPGQLESLSKEVSGNNQEFEVLKTEQSHDPAADSFSQTKTGAPDNEREPPKQSPSHGSHAGAEATSRTTRGGPLSLSLGMEPPASEVALCHARAQRVAREPDEAADGGPRPTSSSPSITRSGRRTSTCAPNSDQDHQRSLMGENELEFRAPSSQSRVLPGRCDSAARGDEGDRWTAAQMRSWTPMPTIPESHGEEQPPSLLEVPDGSTRTVLHLPVVQSATTPSGSRSPGGAFTTTYEEGSPIVVHHTAGTTTTPTLPASEHQPSGNQCLQDHGEVSGLQPDPSGRANPSGNGKGTEAPGTEGPKVPLHHSTDSPTSGSSVPRGIPSASLPDLPGGHEQSHSGNGPPPAAVGSSSVGGNLGGRSLPGMIKAEESQLSGRKLKRLLRQGQGALAEAHQMWQNLMTCLQEPEGPNPFDQLLCTVANSKTPNCKFVHRLAKLLGPSTGKKQAKLVAEVYNPNRFSSRSKRHGLRAGEAFDLELGHDLTNLGNHSIT